MDMSDIMTELAHTSIHDVLDADQIAQLLFGLLMVRAAGNGTVTIRVKAGVPRFFSYSPETVFGGGKERGREGYNKTPAG